MPISPRLRRVSVIVGAIAVVVAFATFIWPTRYREFHLRTGPTWALAARQDRFTGDVSVLTVEGWTLPLAPPDEDPIDKAKRLRAEREAAVTDSLEGLKRRRKEYSSDNPFKKVP